MTTELNPHVASIVDVVMNRSHGCYGREFVRELVTEFVAEFDGAPVQDFIDVLVTKEAMDELRRLEAIAS
jgi:hypothetical protein